MFLRLRNQFLCRISNKLEYLIAALGLLGVVVLIWQPLGLSPTDTREGWEMLRIVQSGALNFQLRPFVDVPWKLAVFLFADSFIGVNLVYALIFFLKAWFFYAILRFMKLVQPSLAFLTAFLFLLYPADQGIFLLRAIGRQFAVLVYIIAILSMIRYCQTRQIRFFVSMLVAEFISNWSSEQAFLLSIFSPLLLLLVDDTSTLFKKRVGYAWLSVQVIYLISAGISFATTNTDSSYQAVRFREGLNANLLNYISDIFYSNFLAYWRVYIDGWLIAFKKIFFWDTKYLIYSLVVALFVLLVNWVLSYYGEQVSSLYNFRRRGISVLLFGFAIVGLSFAPYSITSARFDYLRVFYYAALGGAITISISYLYIYRFLGANRWVGVVFWFSIAILITYNAYMQREVYVFESYAQQKVLSRIVAQAPAVQPNTTIVMIVDDAVSFPFVNNRIFSYGLHWLYNRTDVTGIVCFEKEDSKLTCGDQTETSDYSLSQFSVNMNLAIVFRMNKDRIILLGDIPEKYQSANIAFYRPYERIIYFPFPERAIKVFSSFFIPKNKDVLPQNWQENNLTLNDRKVCNQAHFGHCAMLFYSGNLQKDIFQMVRPSKHSLDEFSLTFWHRGQRPFAVVLMIEYMDKSVGQFQQNVIGRLEWSQEQIIIKPEKPVMSIYIQFSVDPGNEILLLDDIELLQTNQQIPVENPSFEK